MVPPALDNRDLPVKALEAQLALDNRDLPAAALVGLPVPLDPGSKDQLEVDSVVLRPQVLPDPLVPRPVLKEVNSDRVPRAVLNRDHKEANSAKVLRVGLKEASRVANLDWDNRPDPRDNIPDPKEVNLDKDNKADLK